MILVADSGSTKTDWRVGQESFTTSGMNPYQMTMEQMEAVLADVKRQMPDVPLRSIHFYGAGCTAEKIPVMEAMLCKCFGDAVQVEVGSDMLGACRALCGKEEGLVCILGTGSNSCRYDGHKMVDNIPPLGYILGDEGGGAYIGKKLVSACLKRRFSSDLCRLFLEETQLSQADIIEHTYRQPLANRFLAGLSPFCARHREHPEVHELLKECFCDFVEKNLLAYGRHDLPVHFVGSIAYYYEPELKEALQAEGFVMGHVVKSPIERLYHYYFNEECK